MTNFKAGDTVTVGGDATFAIRDSNFAGLDGDYQDHVLMQILNDVPEQAGYRFLAPVDIVKPAVELSKAA